MNELVEFLLARIAEDEAVARAASAGGRWRYEGTDTVGAWTLYDEHWSIASLSTYPRSEYDYAERLPAFRPPYYVDTDANGAHIARHDPARVLARCEADRKLIELITARRHQVVSDCWYTCPAATEEVEGETTCNDTERGKPCNCGRDADVNRALTLLALPHAGHPDYREEFRP